MNMNSLLLNTNKRVELLSGYRRFLEQAEANKACIIKYAPMLSREQYTDQIQKADLDIDFAYRKMLELSIPSISVPSVPAPVPAMVSPAAPSLPVLPAGANTGGDIARLQEEIDQHNAGVWSLFGGFVLAAGTAGLLAWGMHRKENLETVGDVLHAVNTVMNPGK